MSKNRNTRVKLANVQLVIGDKTINLTMEQAKELKDILNDTFGQERVIYRDWWRPWYYNTTSLSNKDGYASGTITVTNKGDIPATSDKFDIQVGDNWAVYQSSNCLQLKAA